MSIKKDHVHEIIPVVADCFPLLATEPPATLLKHPQFPLAPAYSCQGLTLDKIVIDVTHLAFSRGQLYTAVSRVRRRDDLVILSNTENIKKNYIRGTITVIMRNDIAKQPKRSEALLVSI